jgi:hypothetical protein
LQLLLVIITAVALRRKEVLEHALNDVAAQKDHRPATVCVRGCSSYKRCHEPFEAVVGRCSAERHINGRQSIDGRTESLKHVLKDDGAFL